MGRAFLFDLPEIARVRLAAHGGALVVAGLALLLILSQRVPLRGVADGASLGSPSISAAFVSIERPPTMRRPPHEIQLADADEVDAPQTDASDGEGHAPLRMWLDGAAGTVAFQNPDDYLRCLDAALDHVQAAGCPAPPPRLAEDQRDLPNWARDRRSRRH